jgi:hypothetical protein
VGGIDDLRQLAALDHFFKAIHGNLPNAAHQENSNRVMQPFSFGSSVKTAPGARKYRDVQQC